MEASPEGLVLKTGKNSQLWRVDSNFTVVSNNKKKICLFKQQLPSTEQCSMLPIHLSAVNLWSKWYQGIGSASEIPWSEPNRKCFVSPEKLPAREKKLKTQLITSRYGIWDTYVCHLPYHYQSKNLPFQLYCSLTLN